jgi:phospholipase D1/2
MQVVRSVSQWSANFLHATSVEQSIHEAYIQAIRTARHYIYIENQFFISLVTPQENKVENRVNYELYERIVAAHK